MNRELTEDEKTTATVSYHDQGGGGISCDKCKYHETWGLWTNKCPNCKRYIVTTATYYPHGGSDF